MPLDIADFGGMVVVDSPPMFGCVINLVVVQNVMVEFTIDEEPLFPNHLGITDMCGIGVENARIDPRVGEDLPGVTLIRLGAQP